MIHDQIGSILTLFVTYKNMFYGFDLGFIIKLWVLWAFTSTFISENVDFDPGPNTLNLTSNGSADFFVIDESNVDGNYVTLLPKDPDNSARLIRNGIRTKSGKKVAVIISDTFLK